MTTSFIDESLAIWASGGWLMAPLLALAVYIFYIGLELFLRLNTHFLIRNKAHRMSDPEIARRFTGVATAAGPLLLTSARTVDEVRRHFVEIRSEYLPVVKRRIRFLAIIVTTGPLIGLLGTVTGMLSTFSGMVSESGDKFSNMIRGISEALITTQSGLIISIPGFVLLSLIIERRKTLERCLSCLERYNTRLALRKKGDRNSISSPKNGARRARPVAAIPAGSH